MCLFSFLLQNFINCSDRRPKTSIDSTYNFQTKNNVFNFFMSPDPYFNTESDTNILVNVIANLYNYELMLNEFYDNFTEFTIINQNSQNKNQTKDNKKTFAFLNNVLKGLKGKKKTSFVFKKNFLETFFYRFYHFQQINFLIYTKIEQQDEPKIEKINLYDELFEVHNDNNKNNFLNCKNISNDLQILYENLILEDSIINKKNLKNNNCLL